LRIWRTLLLDGLFLWFWFFPVVYFLKL
jgi:hypothetical protein